jgi:SAM-dependent methyltransferase
VKKYSSIPKLTNTSNGSTADSPYIAAYGSKEVLFKFRGKEYRFALSHGLFSSAGIDSGSRLLLKVVSNILDEEKAGGRFLPRLVLDSGCGAGVLGVCAAGAWGLRVRAQDRDELARIFTGYNARRNGISGEVLSAYTEPLLSCPPGWDLILSNIPAKAGLPVLEDFISRSLRLLNPGGRVCIVAVAPLGDFFKERILKAGAAILREETGPEYRIFAYAPKPPGAAQETASRGGGTGPAGEDFLAARPCYLRNRGVYNIEGISYSLDTIYGAPGFDKPGGAAGAAAKLIRKTLPEIPKTGPVLVWKGDQGHFPAWLVKGFFGDSRSPSFTLSGRNILALEAARHNTLKALGSWEGVRIIPAVDLFLDRERLAGAGSEMEGTYSLIAAFPEAVPRTERFLPFWEGLGFLAAPGALVILSLPSAGAEKADRNKPKNFTRLGSLRRGGFRALAYRKL